MYPEFQRKNMFEKRLKMLFILNNNLKIPCAEKLLKNALAKQKTVYHEHQLQSLC